MKKIIAVTLCFFLFISSKAQENAIKVVYNKLHESIWVPEVLIANQSKAISNVEKTTNKNSTSMSIDENDDGTIKIINSTSVNEEKYHKSINDSVQLIQDVLNNKKIFYDDTIKNMNWALDPIQTKKIGSYLCHKATLEFRGTSWTAWFCMDLPIPFGPWKFKGLPGVILEISDDQYKENTWVATNVVYPYVGGTSILEKKDNITSKIKHKEFVKNKEEEASKFAEIIRSRAPKGAMLSDKTIERKGPEKKYDWEK